MKYAEVGHITKSRFWLSIEFKPTAWTGISFGPTYGGTVAGVVAGFGKFVIIGHIRGKA